MIPRHVLRMLLQPPQAGDTAPKQHGGGGAHGVNATVRHALRSISASIDDHEEASSAAHTLVFLLPKVGVPACAGKLFVKLDADAPLSAALAGCWLVEFPTVVVLPGSDAAAYKIAATPAPEAAMPDNKWL